MKKLLMTRDFPPSTISVAQTRLDVTVRNSLIGMTVTESTKALQSYDAILCTMGDQFPSKAFNTDDIRCGILANFGVGYNHIDIDSASIANVRVCNTPEVVTDATADIAMTLLMMASRRTGEGERQIRAGNWQGWHPMQMLGSNITGKRLGIIGMGRIGHAIAKRAHYGFGMSVTYYNRNKKIIEVPSRQVASLGELMDQIDAVIVTVPGGQENSDLVGADALSRMKDGAVLVNIARGNVVSEDALIAELQTGRISAGLDVYKNEPAVPSALTELENVVLLPHLGTATMEVRTQMGAMALDNIFAWIDGRALPQGL